MILATSASSRLRAGIAGLGLVRYWSFHKHALGAEWEAGFPSTIYLVGCDPPYLVDLYCSDVPSEKVLYINDDSCANEPPASEYIFAWDRRGVCPSAITGPCADGVLVVEPAQIVLCLTVSGDDIGFPVSYVWDPWGSYYYLLTGCVFEDPWWRNYGAGVGCAALPAQVKVLVHFSNGQMAGDSDTGWSLGPIFLSPEGKVTMSGGASWGDTGAVGYGGEGAANLPLNSLFKLPEGSTSIEVMAINCGYWNPGQYQWVEAECCPDDYPCKSVHERDCHAGTITVTVAIRVFQGCT